MLETFMKYYKELDIIINNNENNNKVAVIIEPRNHKYLIPVIKQVMSKFDNTWNLRIFGSDMNKYQIEENIKGTYCFVNLGINDLVSSSAYSLLMQSMILWNKIPEEHIIIFQTDSFIINNNYNIPTKYGFFGAYYNYGMRTENGIFYDMLSPLHKSPNICGGFSYRRKSVMTQCIQNVNYNDIIEYRKQNNLSIDLFTERTILPEDVFFQNAMVILGYDYPTDNQEYKEFCINTFYKFNDIEPLTAFAIHPFDKFNKEDVDNICSHLLNDIQI